MILNSRIKKCTLKLMNALLLHKFKNKCIETILWTRNTIFPLFVCIGTLGEKAIQSYEYHIVQRHINEGFKINKTIVGKLHMIDLN